MTFQALAEGSTKVTVSGVSAASDGGAELAVEEGDSTFIQRQLRLPVRVWQAYFGCVA